MPTQFAPPVNVSPLIRFGRYSMLLVGLGYGAFWQSRYTKKELALKDIKAKEKAARDARLAFEKKIRDADEFEFLGKLDQSDVEIPSSPFAGGETDSGTGPADSPDEDSYELEDESSQTEELAQKRLI